MEHAERTYHKRLIDMCDCYMETDFPAQLQTLARMESKDPDEDAIRYLALAIMQAINKRARKLSFKKKDTTTITMENDAETILPVPGEKILNRIFPIMAEILHLEGEKTETVLCLGLRNDQLDIKVKLEMKDGKSQLKMEFPQD